MGKQDRLYKARAEIARVALRAKYNKLRANPAWETQRVLIRKRGDVQILTLSSTMAEQVNKFGKTLHDNGGFAHQTQMTSSDGRRKQAEMVYAGRGNKDSKRMATTVVDSTTGKLVLECTNQNSGDDAFPVEQLMKEIDSIAMKNGFEKAGKIVGVMGYETHAGELSGEGNKLHRDAQPGDPTISTIVPLSGSAKLSFLVGCQPKTRKPIMKTVTVMPGQVLMFRAVHWHQAASNTGKDTSYRFVMFSKQFRGKLTDKQFRAVCDYNTVYGIE